MADIEFGDTSASDETLALQIQSFLDEWMFRILHAGMATQWDRQEAILKAVQIFEAMGMQIVPLEAKEQIIALEDEFQMCTEIARLIPSSMARNLESFFLQLQLAVSTVARVRGAIEDDAMTELIQTMEDSDSGISQTIMKNVVLCACSDIGDIQETQKGWSGAMKARESRLSQAAEEAESNAKELKDLERQITVFGSEQNAKTSSIIMGLNANNTKMILQMALTVWIAHFTKYKSEKHIHDKWKKQIAETEDALVKFKMGKKSGMKSIMGKQYLDHNDALQREVIREWVKCVAEEKDIKAISGEIADAQNRLKSMQANQKENAKKAMMKVAGQSEGAVLDVIWKEWTKFVQDIKKDKELHDQIKESEAKMKAFQAKGKEGAKNVLNRMGGGTDTGLLAMCLQYWEQEVNSLKKARAVEEQISGANSKFSMLRDRNKQQTGNRVQTANELENSIIMMHIFMNWNTYLRITHFTHHYSSKMDTKKKQLEQVQQMFKTFATQLEQGIGNTPRSQRKSQRNTEAAKPPLQP